jgi:hypothetical protein
MIEGGVTEAVWLAILVVFTAAAWVGHVFHEAWKGRHG